MTSQKISSDRTEGQKVPWSPQPDRGGRAPKADDILRQIVWQLCSKVHLGCENIFCLLTVEARENIFCLLIVHYNCPKSVIPAKFAKKNWTKMTTAVRFVGFS